MEGASNASPVASSVPSPEERLSALLLSPLGANSRIASLQAYDILPYLDMEGNEVYSHSKISHRSIIVSAVLSHQRIKLICLRLKQYCLSPVESANLDGAPIYRDNVSLSYTASPLL